MAGLTLVAGIVSKSFDTYDLGLGLATGESFAMPNRSGGFTHAKTIGWRISTSSDPTTLTTVLEGSYDSVDWFTLDTSTIIAGEARSVSFALVRFVRSRITVITGGSSKTLTIEFII